MKTDDGLKLLLEDKVKRNIFYSNSNQYDVR